MFRRKTFGLLVSFLLVFSLLLVSSAFAEEILLDEEFLPPSEGVLPIGDEFTVPLNNVPVFNEVTPIQSFAGGAPFLIIRAVASDPDFPDGFVSRMLFWYNGVLVADRACEGSFCVQVVHVDTAGTGGLPFSFKVVAVDNLGGESAFEKSGVVDSSAGFPKGIPAVCTPGYQKYYSLEESSSVYGCPSGTQARAFCAPEGQWETPSCFSLAQPAPSPSPSPAPSPAPSNAAPVIASFVVPSSADKGANIVLSVTATDDVGVDKIEISKDSSVISSQSCGSVLSCTKSFIVAVPDAFDAVYTFVAKAFDTAGASASASAGGKTKSAPVVSPPVVPPAPSPAPDKVLKPVDLKVVRDALFISGLVPDSSCVAPGAETFLFASLKNRGSTALKDVKITARVNELGIYSSSGSFKIRGKSSTSQYVYFSVPQDAVKGDYYLRIVVSSQKDSVVRYLPFEVSPLC